MTSQEEIFRNPIIPGFNPDPSICRVNDDYFLVTSTFEYFPGLPIYHSTDLLNWKLTGHVLTRRSQLDMRTTEPSGGIWAPTLRYHDGWFYVAVGCTQRFRPKDWDIVIPRGFYVKTRDIFKPDSWTDPVYFDVPGIDQDLFFDDDGKVYFSAVNQITEPGVEKHGLGLATHTCEIDLETGSSLGESAWVRKSDVGIGIAEGPHIFKKDGTYYLSTAEGGTDEGHQQWICRSTTGPLGPWEEGPRGKINPILFNGDDPDIRNTGHMDLVEGVDGQWWAVFLGKRLPCEDKSLLSQLGRETFLASVQWEDGWPIVNSRRRVGLQSKGKGMRLLDQPKVWRDDFSQPGPDLALGWYSFRTPLKREYSLYARPGSLTMYGNAYRLQDSESPCMVLQKQTQFCVDWRTQIEFQPAKMGHEAGTAIWLSQYAHATIGLRRSTKNDAGAFEIVCRCYNDDADEFIETIHNLSSEAPGKTSLLIRARESGYELCFSPFGEQRSLKLGEVSTKTLTHRKHGKESPNTGAFFALYAQGAYGMQCRDPAYFKFAEWEAVL